MQNRNSFVELNGLTWSLHWSRAETPCRLQVSIDNTFELPNHPIVSRIRTYSLKTKESPTHSAIDTRLTVALLKHDGNLIANDTG